MAEKLCNLRKYGGGSGTTIKEFWGWENHGYPACYNVEDDFLAMMGNTDGWTNYNTINPISGKYLEYTSNSNYIMTFKALKACTVKIIYRQKGTSGQMDESHVLAINDTFTFSVTGGGVNWRYGCILVL